MWCWAKAEIKALKPQGASPPPQSTQESWLLPQSVLPGLSVPICWVATLAPKPSGGRWGVLFARYLRLYFKMQHLRATARQIYIRSFSFKAASCAAWFIFGWHQPAPILTLVRLVIPALLTWMKNFGLFNHLRYGDIRFTNAHIPTENRRSSLIPLVNSSFHPSFLTAVTAVQRPRVYLSSQSFAESQGTTLALLQASLWALRSLLLASSSHHWTMSCTGICLHLFFSPCWKCLILRLGSWFISKCHLSSHLSIPLFLCFALRDEESLP